MALWNNTDIEASRPTWINLDMYPAGTRIIFVDEEETQTSAAKLKGIKGPGWYLYYEYEDSGGTMRYKTELVVAMRVHPEVSGDAPLGADDDIVPALATLVIDVEPVDAEVVEGLSAAFTVEYTVDPVDAEITEIWMVSDDEGASWALATGDNYDVSVPGTLTITETTLDMNGYQYYVVLNSGQMPEPVESAVATLTVTADEG